MIQNEKEISKLNSPQSAVDGNFILSTGEPNGVKTITPDEVLNHIGVTVSKEELNHLDGVVSNIQNQLNDKAASSHGTHVTYSTSTPIVAGTATVGTAANVSRGDHVHPVQTTISGNAGSATKLATARTINGTSFNGTANINTAYSYNLNIGASSSTAFYTMFARTPSSNATGNVEATFLISGLGNFGSPYCGLWLVTVSNRGSTPSMRVITLSPHASGTVSFGYYKTTDYFYFGALCSTYRSGGSITVLSNVGVTISDFGDSTTAPTGWTAVTPTVSTLSTGATFTGAVAITNTTASTSTTTGALKVSGGLGVVGAVYSSKVVGAVWNDYAEYRECIDDVIPGMVICENGDDTLGIPKFDMQPGAYIVSDTFGFIIGETEKAKTSVATSGRVLAYTEGERDLYRKYIGYPVCASVNGKVRLMTKDEIKENSWCILGYVSSVPDYDTWGENNTRVDGRIWIKIK